MPTLSDYIHLIRLHKPIGILLLLWPTLWALWLASEGKPDVGIVVIFILGVFLMRSAGCVVNDLADKDVDGFVERTRDRPLASHRVSVRQGMLLAGVLLGLAFILVLFCNVFTIQLAFIGAALAMVYPFLKRITHLPQLGLGVAFGWSVPMAFAAETNTLSPAMWCVFAAAMVWPVIYDTMYAMADRDDDIKIGIKSTAILFGHWDVFILLLLQVLFLFLLASVGMVFHLHYFYFVSLIIVAILFTYQYTLIKHREPQQCFAAFLNNNWVGLVVFLGILTGYYL